MSASPPSGYHASDGAAYQVFLGRWTEVLAPVFLEFARINNDGDVLDVGCGTGSLAAEIARRGPEQRVVGMDVAEPYLTYARAHHALPNLRFELGDAGSLPFADRAFAASFAQLVLTFVPDHRQAVAEMVRVTRPGGVVAQQSGTSAAGSFISGSCGTPLPRSILKLVVPVTDCSPTRSAHLRVSRRSGRRPVLAISKSDR
jgi:ubiquinone/menaquinone biosynthesis C-methylase UbiE